MPDLRISQHRRQALDRATNVYQQRVAHDDIEKHQVRHFNRQWSYCVNELPFYQQWQLKNDLPAQIQSLSDLASFPVLRKADLRENLELVFQGLPEGSYYETGGSTAEPTRFPRGEEESDDAFANNYVGRLWWGLKPYEKSVHVWGHSHLYGVGLRRYAQKAKRYTLDKLGRTLRLDGYQYSDQAALMQLERIITYRPKHIIGYSSAIARIARAVSPVTQARLHALGLSGIVVTSDTLDAADEATIRSAFQCPIIIEYGAAETGVIAVSRNETHEIRVLWASQLLKANKAGTVRVSTLSKRRFPLINYSLDDTVKTREVTSNGSVLSVSEILGRTADMVTVRTNSESDVVLGVLQLTHIIKSHHAVAAVQYSQLPNSRVRVHAQLDSEADLTEVDQAFRRLLHREYPHIDQSAVEVVSSPHQIRTRAGKHMVLRQDT